MNENDRFQQSEAASALHQWSHFLNIVLDRENGLVEEIQNKWTVSSPQLNPLNYFSSYKI